MDTAPDVVVCAPRGRQGGGGVMHRTNSVGRDPHGDPYLGHRATAPHTHHYTTADPASTPMAAPHHLYTPGMASHNHWPGAMFDMARTATLGCMPGQRWRVMLPSSKKTTWKYVV